MDTPKPHYVQTSRGLPTARLTNQANALAGFNGNRKVLNGRREGLASGKINRQILYGEQRRHSYRILLLPSEFAVFGAFTTPYANSDEST